jgi:hypothetical protein
VGKSWRRKSGGSSLVASLFLGACARRKRGEEEAFFVLLKRREEERRRRSGSGDVFSLFFVFSFFLHLSAPHLKHKQPPPALFSSSVRFTPLPPRSLDLLLSSEMYTQQRPLTEQERIDQATMRIDNPNVAIVGSGE